MALYFITGNKGKFREAQSILGKNRKLTQLEMDLPEIQHTDPRVVIKAKLSEALKRSKAESSAGSPKGLLRHRLQGEFIVEDTSLCLDCLNGLPGPLIKWFLKSLGTRGIYRTAHRLGNRKAQAMCIIGYAKNPKDIRFFEGKAEGEIVSPKGSSSFGWDPIFRPEGFRKTFAEMSPEEKNLISHRRMAFEGLREFLER